MSCPKVSIISPVYNAEKYIHKCIDSIIAQTFSDWELILVDDGSPDSSGTICDEYAAKDLRLKVIHKVNGGVSQARQTGLDAATGEYVIHVDPDDWIEPNMLEDLLGKAIADDADMVICDFFWDKAGNSKVIKQTPSALDSDSFLCDLYNGRHGSLCNKLTRRSLFEMYDIKFPKDFNFCEDLIVNTLLLKNKIKIAYVGNAYYHYVQYVNDNSIARKYDEKMYEKDLELKDFLCAATRDTHAHKSCRIYVDVMMIQRAFFSGYFSSYRFAMLFMRFIPSVLCYKRISLLIKLSYLISCIGFYKPIYWIMDKMRK